MESLNKSHPLDLESGGGGVGGGGGGGRGRSPGHPSSTSGGGSSSDEGGEAQSSNSEFAVEVKVDLQEGGGGTEKKKEQSGKTERECRICQLSLDASNQDSGEPVELGCACKADLGFAHKQCAETWFKIKGDKTCEICGSTARNVAGVSGTTNSEDEDAAAHNTMGTQPETRSCLQGHRFLNLLLACMVFAFVISWLFHFNVPQ